MTTKTDTAIDTPPLEVRELPGGRELLPGVAPSVRAVITERALSLLADHPRAGKRDVSRLVNLLWEDLRARTYDTTGRTVETGLSVPTISGPIHELSLVLYVLVASGDLLKTLLAQRAALDQQIAKLEGVRRPR